MYGSEFDSRPGDVKYCGIAQWSSAALLQSAYSGSNPDSATMDMPFAQIEESNLRQRMEALMGIVPKWAIIIYEHGWGNGYVHLPKGHKYFGIDANDIPYEVHGGLTFADEIDGYWVIGFDTCHYGDTLEKWPKKAVWEETQRLLRQAVADVILADVV